MGELEQLFADEELPESQQIGAANALATFARSDRPRLARLLSTATAAQYEILYPLLSNRPNRTVKDMLEGIVLEQPSGDLSERDRLALGQRRAGAAISLLRLGEAERSFGVFAIRDDSESLTQFVHRCRVRGVTAKQLIQSLHKASDVYDRFGLLLALGDYPLMEIDLSQRDSLVLELIEAYRGDPSSAIHGAAGWLLRKWGYVQEVTNVDRTPLPYDRTENREWFVMEMSPRSSGESEPTSEALNDRTSKDERIYFTFIVFRPCEYVMGSPEDAGERQADEDLHQVRLTRPIAVSAYEITWAQYDPLDGGQTRKSLEQQVTRECRPGEPVFGVNWFETARYCRWLTQLVGLSESEQCYEDERTLPHDADGNPEQWPVHLDRHGFRLLTEAEWEYICRCGTRTTYGFGSDARLLPHYGWFIDNSEKWAHEVGQSRPNLRGLFDVHGNVYEWCYDWYGADMTGQIEDPVGPASGSFRVFRGGGWYVSPAFCRAAVRLRDRPVFRSIDLGFRVAIVPSADSVGSANTRGHESR